MKFKNELLKCNLSPTLSEFRKNGKVCKTNLRKFKKFKGINKRNTSSSNTYYDSIRNKVSFQQKKKLKKTDSVKCSKAADCLSNITEPFNIKPDKQLQTKTEYVVTKLKNEKIMSNTGKVNDSHLNWNSSVISSTQPSYTKDNTNDGECNTNGSFVYVSDSSSDSDECTIENLTQTEDSDTVMLESSDSWKEIGVVSNDIEDEPSSDSFDRDIPEYSNLMEDENDLQAINNSLENIEFTCNKKYDDGLSALQEIKIIDIDGKRLVVLQKDTNIYFNGFATIQILYGAVEIMGSILSENNTAVEIYSPRGTSLLYIRVVEFSNVLDTNKLSQLNIEQSERGSIFSMVHEGVAVILMENHVKLNVPHLEKHIPQQIFPREDNAGFRLMFLQDPADWNVITISQRWEELSKSIAMNSKVILCGGKGVGKSTLLRYLINNLLMRYQAVRVIDLDPGQPEFTVPGCVSMSVINKPVFGPSFTHISKTDKCIFVPNIDISFNPEEYLTCVQELLVSCKNTKTIPTLINYMGYSRGLGTNLVANIIAETQPTMLVQIQSRYAKKNFSHMLTPDFVQQYGLPILSNKQTKLNYSFVTIESMSDSRRGWDLQPRQIRELKVLAYLSQSLPNDVVTITSSEVPVFRTSLKNVKFIANGSEVSPAVVNANFVALATLRCSKNKYKVFESHGWGVVRGINLSTDELFLITPEPIETLDKTEFVIYGNVSLPPSVYMTSDDVCDLVPYVSAGVLSSFSLIPKRSHVPKYVKNLDV